MDVNASREVIEQYEYESGDVEMFSLEENMMNENQTKHPLGHTFDVCMDGVFNYFIKECEDDSTGEVKWESVKGMTK